MFSFQTTTRIVFISPHPKHIVYANANAAKQVGWFRRSFEQGWFSMTE
jgi:hypothetical protein